MIICLAPWIRAQGSKGGAAHFERGLELQKAGKLEEAIAEYKQALKPAPQFAALANMGIVYAQLGRFEEAIAAYEEALKLAPGQPVVMLNLGLAYYKIGNLEKAKTTLGAVVRKEPENRQARTLLADCNLRLDDHRRTIELLEPVADQFPEDLAVAYILGNAYLRDGQLEKGQKYIDRIMSKGDSAEAHLLLGMAYVVGLRTQSAMEEFRRALEMNPNLPLAHVNLGKELLRMGDEGALPQFEAEMKINPNDFDANFYAGYLRRRLRDFDTASKYLTKALQLRPNDSGALLQIGLIHTQKDEWDQAQSILEGIIKREPGFAEAHTTLARVYFRKKMMAEGEREQKIGDKLLAEQDAQKVNAERKALSKAVLDKP
jgi:tetratricopeptide (TPR) repeat protein